MSEASWFHFTEQSTQSLQVCQLALALAQFVSSYYHRRDAGFQSCADVSLPEDGHVHLELDKEG